MVNRFICCFIDWFG